MPETVHFGQGRLYRKGSANGEDRSFPHDAATKDFGYNPMPFEEGIGMEVEEYLGKMQLQ